MSRLKHSFLALLLLFNVPVLFAQTEDLTRDDSFFIAQVKQYQRWLDHAGLGRTLRARTVEVEPQRLSLYLEFPTTDADSAFARWQGARAGYAQLGTGLSLDQALFYKAIQLMEVRQSALNVQLYDTYDTRREPCFFRAIYSREGRLTVDSSGCKAPKKIDPIYLSAADLAGLKKPNRAEFFQKYNQDSVFNRLHRYARQRYERQTCVNRHPNVSPPQIDGNLMRFEVVDLCREVVKNAPNSAVCAFLDRWIKPCNWIQREKLIFTVVYEKQGEGIVLKCTVEGKVGSGFYDEVGRGGYLDMEIDFDGSLRDYARDLQYDFRQALLKK